MTYARWCAATVQCAEQLLNMSDAVVDMYTDVLLWRIIAALKPASNASLTKITDTNIDRYYRRMVSWCPLL